MSPDTNLQSQKVEEKDTTIIDVDAGRKIEFVKKHDGSIEEFLPEKIAKSVEAVLKSLNIKDINKTVKITGYIVDRIFENYGNQKTIGTDDIRKVVELTFIDQNLTQATKLYIEHKFSTSGKSNEPVYGNGLSIQRKFTKPGVHPYDEIKWELRDARITNEKGEAIFEQKDVEVPTSWSQTATNIVVQKYFSGSIGTPGRETSVRQLVTRVAKTISDWGRSCGYFKTAEDAEIFENELTFILVNQYGSFNSPVWFNVGLKDRKQQCSACFINSVQDDMHSILSLTITEGMLFKYGSGTGTNLSVLRSSREHLSNSINTASGPVSFMKAYDAVAGVVKSGGKTRRAAKMVILNIEHPDVLDFIKCKAEEEKKAWALIDAGYDGSMNGAAYQSIFFQNANNSVRVTDEFMQAVVDDKDWWTRYVKSGEPCEKYKARELMKEISEAAWQCGDPGMQYDTTTNRWHTAKNTARINASNPCSEFMYIDDSACNLASLNLMKFRTESGEFDPESFKHACEIIITAQEIIVDNSAYPTPAIEQNSHDHRPLGIGYANLGALLMARGLPYDSDEGRNFAAAITSIMTGASYLQSSKIAKEMGPFKAYKENREPMLDVIGMHRDYAYKINSESVPEDMVSVSKKVWDEALLSGKSNGFRNAQVSLLAPTGTIAFLMDCDTTGIEPDIALVKYKWLVGGGMLKLINGTVPEALARLGYSGNEIDDIVSYINEKDTIEGAPHLKEEHVAVFDCAFKPQNGKRAIHYTAHLRMMAATQPFLSGAISKTVNMPQESTPEEIANVYIEGWKMGLKAIAIYRDGSKRQQPLTTSLKTDQKKTVKEEEYKPRRRRLPDERKSLTHKFTIGNHEGYITVGLYDDGNPGEIFITMSKEGSVISGLMDSFATSISIALQYGVPLRTLVNKFVHMRFEPSGFTANPSIRIAKSIVDYVFRWLALKFLPQEEQMSVGLNFVKEDNEPVAVAPAPAPVAQVSLFATKVQDEKEESPRSALAGLTQTFNNMSDAPVCDTCGAIMVRNAACYKCLNCGSTSGCS